jgi:hypothetical protein
MTQRPQQDQMRVVEGQMNGRERVLSVARVLIIAMMACNAPSGEPTPTEEELASPDPSGAVTAVVPTASSSPPSSSAEPTQSPTASPLSIGGVLWHEICEFSGGEAGEPVVLGTGCVQYGEGPSEFGPNQILDPFETGWEGVTLHLGAGACPSIGLAAAITDAAGEYVFTGLSPGTYCVSYDSLSDGNDVLLIPGGPTYPDRGEAGFEQTVELEPGIDQLEINFGYAYQFFN